MMRMSSLEGCGCNKKKKETIKYLDSVKPFVKE
jgi:hypothetical protein